MKHLRKFEDADYMDMLASQKKSRENLENIEIERKEIVQKVIDGLIADLNNNPGYQSFKEELLAFLDEFPKE